MSGGEAFVLDLHGHLPELANREMIEMKRVAAGPEAERLRGLIERHASETDSARARAILETWADALPTFWRVTPKAAVAAAPEVVVVKAGTREAAKA
jgi:glutamate synthase domain-containing protein 3